MRFLADMGISRSSVEWLLSHGHEAKHLRDEGLQRLADKKIFDKARKENRIILTFDLDFGEIAAFAPKVGPSIIIFRLQDERPANVNSHLQVVLDKAGEALMEGAVISVGENRFRVRRFPIIPK
jgi:predicted nuclease of predicted toxin-antitoxin system